jgi:uncharacterized protein
LTRLSPERPSGQSRAGKLRRTSEPAICLSVFVQSGDRFGGRPLHQEIVDRARLAGLAGVTVSRGLQGFGSSGREHRAGLLRSGYSLPVLIEIVAPEDRVRAFLPALDEVIGSGLITLRVVTSSWPFELSRDGELAGGADGALE